ncbi:MAG: glycosyltransferase [Limisphaerales bacterium]
MNPALCKEKIAQELKIPILFYPDLSGTRWPRRAYFLKALFELLLFLIWLPRICRAIKKSGAQRLFAFFGGYSRFLFVAGMVARWSRLPLDVYLVDDLVESAHQSGQPWMARLARWAEPRLLKRASRIFVISPAYAEHLQSKYGIKAEWLPIPFRSSTIEYQSYDSSKSDVRCIVFLGAVNILYVSALVELLEVIKEWNAQENSFKIKLSIMTYNDPDFVKKQFGNSADVEIFFRLSNEECRKKMKNSWFIFLPSSFDEAVRPMVRTSFPSKVAECLSIGRPLLVYGPTDSSLSRYFKENNLPLCVHSPDKLKEGLHKIKELDTPELIRQYEAVILRLHSSEAIRDKLG